jgi:hypothetical protein
MLTIKSQGLTLADLRTSPIRDIVELFIKYHTETRDEILHGMPRVLALGSDLHPILEGTEWGYVMQFINRHYTLSVYNRRADYFEPTEEMHRFEVIRITETEEGR